jgi:hypothetical protein
MFAPGALVGSVCLVWTTIQALPTAKHAMNLLKTLLTATALLAGTHLSAHAFCGFMAGKAESSLFNETSQVLLVRDGKRTVLAMQNDYQGPLNEFVLVVPTPTTLTAGQVRLADPAMFSRLDEYSSPRLEAVRDKDPCDTQFRWSDDAFNPFFPGQSIPEPVASARVDGASGGRVEGITVESRYSLGTYDIVNLSATQSEGLETWLQQNGYRVPAGASAALKPYIRQGMKFFVAKVNLQAHAKSGYSKLRPLQFVYESDQFMLPLRLGLLNAPPDRMQDLVIYAITRAGRVESSNYRTLKVPANVNLPYFMAPEFGSFYKDVFDRQVQKARSAVFTEYFWNLAFCTACTQTTLRMDELLNFGVFWVYGHDDANFEALRTPGARLRGYEPSEQIYSPEFPALTRLHVRYSANTFPEDLMLIETRDQEDWQARYEIRQPYASSVSACSAQVGKLDCQAQCSDKVNFLFLVNQPSHLKESFRGKSREALQAACRPACKAFKQTALDGAARYYAQDLPTRLRTEKQTLAELSGWSMARIEAMPGADKVWGHDQPVSQRTPVPGRSPYVP